MIYADVCAGISAATAAWKPLGWQTAFYSEIEPFPSKVLAHHYPETPNYGDMTKWRDWPDANLDVLIGGTPCQGFSLAGLRGGLDDDRSNLALEFLRIAGRYRPRWLLWENVPGARSQDEGRDLAAILGGMEELGYGVVVRSLDAQYFDLAQRRERLFALGYLGDWRPAAAVLLNPEGMRGDSAPSREAGQNTSSAVAQSAAFGGGNTSGPIDVAATLVTGSGTKRDFEVKTLVTHSLTGEGFDASEDGTGRGTPIVPVCFDETQITSVANRSNPKPGDPAHPLAAQGRPPAIAFNARQDPISSMERCGPLDTDGGTAAIAIQERATSENVDAGPDGKGWSDDGVAYTLEARSSVQAVAFDLRGREGGSQFEGPHDTAAMRAASGGSSRSYVATDWAVRRLTPRECERLQGFPDDFTLIPIKGAPSKYWDQNKAYLAASGYGENFIEAHHKCPDGPRYKALGNSIAVPVLHWIGRRIELCEKAIADAGWRAAA